MYYANENRLGNESPHDNKYPFDLENKSLRNWKSYPKQTLLFSQRNQDRKIMCESDMGGNKSYKMLWTWALEHPSTIWLRHWVQGTSNEISVETEYCTHSKLQQAFFYLEGKKIIFEQIFLLQSPYFLNYLIRKLTFLRSQNFKIFKLFTHFRYIPIF